MRCDGGRDVYYPALSAPLGSEDELSCPPDHVAFLRQTLESMGPLNLLVIGYSGYDQEVLRLLKEHTAGVKSLLVANGTENASRETAARIMEQSGKGFGEGSVFAGGFGELVSTGRLREYVGSVV
jgi:hypothetical protein